MNDTNKARLLGKVLRSVPVPGRYLEQVIRFSRLRLDEVKVPVICTDRWNEIKFCIRDAEDLVERHILLQGYFEFYESMLVRSMLKQGGTFIDVGANVGWHSMLAAKRVGAEGRVLAFEPVSSTYSRLLENVHVNEFENVTAIQAGLSSEKGEAEIFQPESANAGGNSLYTASQNDHAIETVNLVKGDDVLEEHDVVNVDLCKIDIEGAELRAIEGLRRSLTKGMIRNLIIEANPEALARSGGSVQDLTAVLRSFGFVLSEVRNPRKEIDAKQAAVTGGNLICRLAT